MLAMQERAVRKRANDPDTKQALSLDDSQGESRKPTDISSTCAVHELNQEDDFDFCALSPPGRGINQAAKNLTGQQQQTMMGAELQRRTRSSCRGLSIASEVTAQTALPHLHSSIASMIPHTTPDVEMPAHASYLSDSSVQQVHLRGIASSNERQVSVGSEAAQEIQFSVQDSSMHGTSTTHASSPTLIMSTNRVETNFHASKLALGPSRASQFTSFATVIDRSQRAVDTFDMSETAPILLQPPSPKASLEKKMDFLQQQLDSFGIDKPALPDLVFLGNGERERLQGGGFTSSVTPIGSTIS